MIEAITNIDFTILAWIQENLRCPFLDAVLPVFSALGNGGLLWLCLAAGLLCHKKHRQRGALLFLGLAAGFLVVNVLLKPLVARPRPAWLMDFSLLIPSPKDFSFPSGHTASSFIAAFLLTAYRKRLGFLVLPVAALMAFSRLYLYVHYPSDILVSVFLSAGISFCVCRLVQTYEKRNTR